MEPIIGDSMPGSMGSTPPSGDVIKESSTETFMADVIDASMAQPVIVDFWAPWCGPCKQLGPALEKIVGSARGAVRLVKINIDQNQELAAQMRVQSIPAVFAFFQGRPVDGFMGALPESEIKRFVERILKAAGAEVGANPVEEAMEQAQEALDQGQIGTATTLYGQVLQHDPTNLAALAGTIRCHLAGGEAEAAQEIYDALDDDVRADAAFDSIRAALDLASQSTDTGEIPELRTRVAKNESDLEARFELAQALYAAGAREEAVDELLEIVRRNRGWNEEAARKELVKYFDAWGPTDSLTIDSRKRLSSVLFA